MKHAIRLCLLVLLLVGGAGAVFAQDDSADCDASTLDWERVIEACSQLVDDGAAGSYTFWARGYAYAEIGEYELSIIDYTKALGYYSKDTSAYINRGWAYQNLGMLDQALQNFNDALMIEPNNVQALINRGYLFVDMGDFERALADADALTAQGTTDVYPYVEGHLLAGSIHLDQGAFEDALAAFEEAALYAGEDPRISINLGFTYWSMGDFAAAAPYYRAYIGFEGEDFPLELAPEELAGEPFDVTLEDRRYYEVVLSMNEGDLLTVSAVTQDETLDPAVVLTDARGDAIWSDDDTLGGAFGLDALIDGFEVPATGEYILVLGFAGGGQTGTMTVQITIATEA
jgi:Flp pilus assembly protein TadD